MPCSEFGAGWGLVGDTSNAGGMLPSRGTV